MLTPELTIGDRFLIQFVWQIPTRDYLRAVFDAQIEELDTFAGRYIILLASLKAGRQENEAGAIKPQSEYDDMYWRLVGELIGRRAAVAYETADGQPVKLRLATLTREHAFFTRFDR